MTSPSPKRVIAVIPAYNEAGTIASVLTRLLPIVPEIVVVSDGSTDNTGDIARAAGARVIARTENGGYDAALGDGIRAAYEDGADIVVTLDADGEHEPSDVRRVLASIENGTADVVLGTRPNARNLAEAIFAVVTKIRFNVADPLCGMKAYSRSAIERAGLEWAGRYVGTALFMRAKHAGCRISTVQVTLHSREAGDQSRFYSLRLRGSMRVLNALWNTLWL